MKKEHTEYYNQVLNNLRKIMNDRKITQVAMGEMMGAKESSTSKIFKGDASLTLDHLSNLASSLGISVIDILTYSEKAQKSESNPVEAVLQIKLKNDKKDQVLKIVFGDNNLEFLKK